MLLDIHLSFKHISHISCENCIHAHGHIKRLLERRIVTRVGLMLTNVSTVEGGIRDTGFQEMCMAVHFVLFSTLVCYLISELIYHVILPVLVYGLKTLFVFP